MSNDHRTETDRHISEPGRLLPDGREAILQPMLFGKWRLYVGEPDAKVYEDGWWYVDLFAAVAAMTAWDGDGEPEGWYRHPRTGRRRPKGDASREYVQWWR